MSRLVNVDNPEVRQIFLPFNPHVTRYDTLRNILLLILFALWVNYCENIEPSTTTVPY